MDQAVKQSVVTRSGIALGVLVFVSVLNMVVTFLSAEHAENDAVRINISGSLRMQAYRIAEALILEHSAIAYESESLGEQLADFERRFNRPVLAAHLRNSSNEELVAIYDSLERNWLAIKGAAEQAEPDVAALLADIDTFVVAIDKLVKLLETQTESKLKLLRTLQGVSMFITVIIVVVILLDLHSTVLVPLRRLVGMARRLQDGDFSTRLQVERDDELGLLSETFNTMAASLETMYGELEQKVQEKTHHLEQARDELGLLYETSRLLGGDGTIRTRLARALSAIRVYFDAVQASIELQGEHAEPGIAMAVPELKATALEKGSRHGFAIQRQGEQWGDLVVTTSAPEIVAGQRRTLQLVAANIAAAFSAESRNEQQHRLVLMEERNVIARELHDSLAQTLSYLKIQVSRLQMLLAKNAPQQQIDDTLDQVKSAISAAYVQLRELLSTFRLQLSSQGLQAALEATVEEFSSRSQVEVKLQFRLDGVPLSPNEEIHVLQTVREALSNVMRHSRADHSLVTARLSGQVVEVLVADDGIGFGEQARGENHYGMIIMQERAATLNGSVAFANGKDGGAEVSLRFVPAAFSQPAAAIE